MWGQRWAPLPGLCSDVNHPWHIGTSFIPIFTNNFHRKEERALFWHLKPCEGQDTMQNCFMPSSNKLVIFYVHFLKNGYSTTLQSQQSCLYTHHQWALLLALLILFSFHLKCPKILEKNIINTGRKKLLLQILLFIWSFTKVWSLLSGFCCRLPPRQG